MRGHISLTSELNKGSNFSIEIPVNAIYIDNQNDTKIVQGSSKTQQN
jgi:hypothetical protein